MKIHIIYIRYLDEINNLPQIGGLQTYIENLCEITNKLKLETFIYQKSTYNFERKLLNGVTVIGKVCKRKLFSRELVKEAEKKADLKKDLLIFLTSTLICKTVFEKSIAIQHGIYWDISTVHGRKIQFPYDVLFRSIQSIKEIKKIRTVGKIICVDYNYINWLRSQTTLRNINYRVILNFAEIHQQDNIKKDKLIRILFARRFAEIRGVNLLCSFMPRILQEYSNVQLTIAGDGAMKEQLHNVFDEFTQVCFTTYEPSESVKFHSQFDIALVPSIGSEGTSLSLIEAMAAGCAVICTDVGGLSNLIIDGYNGRIIRPDAEDFYQTTKELLENISLRKQLAEVSRDVLKTSLSREIWEKKWIEEINKMM